MGSLQTCIRPFETACPDCDSNGCLTAHGYEFCGETGQCQNKLYSSCPNEWEASATGITLDQYGCCVECGEEWCEASNSCIMPNLFECPYECANQILCSSLCVQPIPYHLILISYYT